MTISSRSMLYRGINKLEDERNGGRIIPKGNAVKAVALHDGRIKADGTFRAGPSQSNTARAQQIHTGLYDACAISTIRSEKAAVEFATAGHTEQGHVYVLSESELKNCGIALYEFKDPIYPAENEVTLVLHRQQPLPSSVIIDKYAVNDNRERM